MKNSKNSKNSKNNKKIKKKRSHSEVMKAYHASLTPEQKQERKRKISESVKKRIAQRPPRMHKSICKKMSISHQKFEKSEKGRINKKYTSYCTKLRHARTSPEEKAKRIEAHREKIKKVWDNRSKAEKDRILAITHKGRDRYLALRNLFYEKDVPRKKNYCGVVTEEEVKA